MDIAIRKIRVRRHNDYAMQASFYGYKIPLRGVSPQVSSPSNEKLKDVKSEVLDNLMAQALERKRREKSGG